MKKLIATIAGLLMAVAACSNSVSQPVVPSSCNTLVLSDKTLRMCCFEACQHFEDTSEFVYDHCSERVMFPFNCNFSERTVIQFSYHSCHCN